MGPAGGKEGEQRVGSEQGNLLEHSEDRQDRQGKALAGSEVLTPRSASLAGNGAGRTSGQLQGQLVLSRTEGLLYSDREAGSLPAAGQSGLCCPLPCLA